MKKLVTTLCAVAVLAGATSAFAANPVRISQVYGGGGSMSGATYTHDYVELFNASGSPVNLSGWYLEYGSATGNWGSSALNQFQFPQGAVIQPCKYLLIQLATVGGAVGSPLPLAADYSGTLTLSATSGKVGLFTALNNNLPCGSEVGGTLVDKVAYGTANCSETTAVPTLSAFTAAIRKLGGNQDTDNNNADFTVEGGWTIHNSASPANVDCLATPAAPASWGKVKNIYR